jgi:hypothetical protein
MKARDRGTQIPGDTDGVTELNNAGRGDPNAVAREREAMLRGKAISTLQNKADLAPGPELDDMEETGEIEAGGERVRFRVPKRVLNPQVDRFGGESKLPRGTWVRKDGTPCEGSETPHGVVGDIDTPQGKLVNRVIPVAVIEAARSRQDVR